VGERSARQVAKAIGKSDTLTSRWCANPRLGSPGRGLGRRAGPHRAPGPKDTIERINGFHGELTQEMLEGARAAIPSAAAALGNQPHALQEWVKTAVKVQRVRPAATTPSSI